MALDRYMTKTGAILGAATAFPTGVITPGGSAVDEIEIWRAPIGRALFPVVYVPQALGTAPTLVVTVETANEITFGTPQLRVTMGTITAAGKYCGGALGAVPDIYARFRAVSNYTGTVAAADFGTPTFALTDTPFSHWEV